MDQTTHEVEICYSAETLDREPIYILGSFVQWKEDMKILLSCKDKTTRVFSTKLLLPPGTNYDRNLSIY